MPMGEMAGVTAPIVYPYVILFFDPLTINIR